MKLRTSLTVSRDGTLVDVSDGNLFHDVAAARALMQAMDDLIKEWGSGGCSFETTKTLLLERADELMRSWGFDSGEVVE